MLRSDVLLHSVILTNTLWARSERPTLSSILRRFRVSADAFSPVSLREGLHVDEDCNDFLPWLENKAGAEISSLLSIGKSAYGRALFASEDIQPGDCLLKVPYSVQLAPGNLPGGISSLLGDEVGDVAKVALLILREKRLGEKSEWAPYVSRLPLRDDLHCSVLWSDEEQEMIRVSGLHEETLKQKEQIEKHFSAVKLVFDRFPGRPQTVTLEDFTYAYGLVTSRAWESSRGVSMIPFADFFNHDGASESYVLSDEGKQRSAVIADGEFSRGDEVRIRYGKFSNATLLMDFGLLFLATVTIRFGLSLRYPNVTFFTHRSWSFLAEMTMNSAVPKIISQLQKYDAEVGLEGESPNCFVLSLVSWLAILRKN